MFSPESPLHKLARSAFAWGKQLAPSKLYLFVLHPLEFKCLGQISDLRYQRMARDYVAVGHEENPWLRQLPLSPRIKVVRHSDGTPTQILHRSDFYKAVLKQAGIEYGASVMVWKKQSCLVRLCFLRKRQEGDFTDAEMDQLGIWQPLLAKAVNNVANRQERQLTQQILEKFIQDLPTAYAVVDWNLNLCFHSAAVARLCHKWHYGPEASTLKLPMKVKLPEDILVMLHRMQEQIQMGKNRSFSESIFKKIPHTSDKLWAKIHYFPSKSFAYSRGFFQIRWHLQSGSLLDDDPYEKLSRLSRRERDCVKLISLGQGAKNIASTLGTSSRTVRSQLSEIYRKLGYSNQVELAAFVARHWAVFSEIA